MFQGATLPLQAACGGCESRRLAPFETVRRKKKAEARPAGPDAPRERSNPNGGCSLPAAAFAASVVYFRGLWVGARPKPRRGRHACFFKRPSALFPAKRPAQHRGAARFPNRFTQRDDCGRRPTARRRVANAQTPGRHRAIAPTRRAPACVARSPKPCRLGAAPRRRASFLQMGAHVPEGRHCLASSVWRVRVPSPPPFETAGSPGGRPVS